MKVVTVLLLCTISVAAAISLPASTASPKPSPAFEPPRKQWGHCAGRKSHNVGTVAALRGGASIGPLDATKGVYVSIAAEVAYGIQILFLTESFVRQYAPSQEPTLKEMDIAKWFGIVCAEMAVITIWILTAHPKTAVTLCKAGCITWSMSAVLYAYQYASPSVSTNVADALFVQVPMAAMLGYLGFA